LTGWSEGRGMSALLEVNSIVSVSFDGFKAINNLSFRSASPNCAP
jgi:ABC-type uncharacterized transport system ATPase subunit